MLGYFDRIKDFFSVPENTIVAFVTVFLIMQGVGEFLEFKGKIVPEFIKIRKYFIRKKAERDVLAKMPELVQKIEAVPDMIQTLTVVKETLADVNRHYSKDNISMRDKWIENVNHKLEESDRWMRRLDEKIDKNNADTLALLIESKRNAIIDFAAYVINESNPVTREQYTRIFKIYDEYEAMIKANGLTNGEVDIAIQIIRESYEHHMRNHTFVEDLRGYDLK